MTGRRILAAAVCAAGMLTAADARAQVPAAPRQPAARFEAAVALTGASAVALGGGDAVLTPNLNGSRFTLFNVSAELAPALGVDARFSYRLAPWLLVGLAGSVGRADVRVTVGADAEGASVDPLTGETLLQAQVEARADVVLGRWRFASGRATPYATVSGGLLRQAHDGNTLIESGSVLHAGGGVRYMLATRPTSRLSRLGLAAEARLEHTGGGFHWGRESRNGFAWRVEFFTGWGR
jgi:hypothetical protein